MQYILTKEEMENFFTFLEDPETYKDAKKYNL